MSKKERNKSEVVLVRASNNKEIDPKTNIELRSGEVQELMSRPPSTILRTGITIILLFVVSFFVASFYMVYPEQMTVMVKLFPSVDVEYVNSPTDGHLLWVIDNMNADVAKGDTLALIVQQPADTICLVSLVDGQAFKTDVLEKNMIITTGQRLFCMSKTSIDERKHKVHGFFYLPVDSSSVLKMGQKVEVNHKGCSYSFLITEFGRIANDEGRIPINISYIDSLGLFANIETETCVARIRTSSQTIFEKFFAKRLNFLDKCAPSLRR